MKLFIVLCALIAVVAAKPCTEEQWEKYKAFKVSFKS